MEKTGSENSQGDSLSPGDDKSASTEDAVSNMHTNYVVQLYDFTLKILAKRFMNINSKGGLC